MKIGMLLGCAAVLVAASGCSEVASRVLPPRPVIVAQSGVDGLSGLDYVGNVSCTVRNDGGSGATRVTATFMQDGTWTRTQTVYLGAGEQRDVTFVFPEATMLSFSSMRYRCTTI